MEALRARLSPESLPPPQISGEGYSQLQAFYAVRNYAPIWVDVAGIGAKGQALLARLRSIAPENPLEAAPLLAETEKRIGASDQRALAELELLLSAAFAAAAVDPNDPAARSSPRDVLVNLAASADVIAALRDQLPIDPAFWRLRPAIWTYRELAARGGWATLPEGPKLELGIRDPAVAGLRQRLLATGDLAEPGTDPEGFDTGLEAALRRFQARHGLEVDGVVGKDTRAALDVPVEARLATLELNLRRLQQQHREWGQRYVAVNAAAATYRLVDGGRLIFERVAIVGRRDWPTPQLDSTIDRLEFNPYWVVPPRIARLEVLPNIRRDPNYMRDNDMHWVGGQIRQNPGRLESAGEGQVPLSQSVRRLSPRHQQPAAVPARRPVSQSWLHAHFRGAGNGRLSPAERSTMAAGTRGACTSGGTWSNFA